MFCVRNNRAGAETGRAFTLLEVVIAVAIIAMIAATIYRFVISNLRAIQYSTQLTTDAAAMQGLMATLQAQLNELPTPADAPGALLGEAHQFSNKASDEMQWICGAGNGLFTEFADGQYQTTFTIQPVPKSDQFEIGLRRQQLGQTVSKDLHWLRLMGKVDALEIRYFQREGLNAWLEKWTDQTTRPVLVRIRIWRTGAESPFEAILTLPLKPLLR